MQDLGGKVVVVTGGARGTGAAVAKKFAERGSRVVITDILDEPGKALASELGGGTRYETLDVTRSADWKRVLTDVQGGAGRVDVLVNNAAILHLGAIENTSEEDMRRVLEVNTMGPFLGLRAVLPIMREHGGGSIVNGGSIDGLTGMNGAIAYCTSKWGLRGLTKAAGLELGRSGIRVNTVCPAGGNPEMYGPWMDQMMPFLEETLEYNKNRGIPGSASVEAIADAVLFFASDVSRHCTGVDLPVDGGASAGHFIPGFNTL